MRGGGEMGRVGGSRRGKGIGWGRKKRERMRGEVGRKKKEAAYIVVGGGGRGGTIEKERMEREG